jgi:hypothetical protein
LEKPMNILGPIFISASAASLFVGYGAPLPTEVQSKQILQNAAARPDAPFGVDAFYGRPHTTHRFIREIVPSPYCR